MASIAPLVLGALLGGALAWFALTRRASAPLAVGLAAAAAIYVGLAVAGGAPGRWLTLELGGLAAFGGLALLGRRAPWLLAAGWALHALWDAPLHARGPGAVYTPDWYVALCLGFDLAAAAGAAAFARPRWRPPASPPAG